ncbi:MAG TPA: ABC transporter permease, partial [Actinoplanes sp.]|nr:ABC transporter permease [Actinoplanes sp.]
MNPVDLLSLGLIGLRTRPGRALLSGLGIAIGIATMIVVTGIPASSQAALLDRLSALGTNTLQATALTGQNPPAVLPESAVAMVRRIGPVTAVSAVANTHTVVRRNDRTAPDDGAGLTVLATRLDLPEVINARVRSGRWLNAATAKFPAVVLGSVAAERLAVTELPTGRQAPLVMIGE